MRSIAGFIIRTSAFVSKELTEILRQTRLLLALVLGEKLMGIPGVKEADVQVVLDPPWDQSRMSDEARVALDMW